MQTSEKFSKCSESRPERRRASRRRAAQEPAYQLPHGAGRPKPIVRLSRQLGKDVISKQGVFRALATAWPVFTTVGRLRNLRSDGAHMAMLVMRVLSESTCLMTGRVGWVDSLGRFTPHAIRDIATRVFGTLAVTDTQVRNVKSIIRGLTALGLLKTKQQRTFDPVTGGYTSGPAHRIFDLDRLAAMTGHGVTRDLAKARKHKMDKARKAAASAALPDYAQPAPALVLIEKPAGTRFNAEQLAQMRADLFDG